MIKRALNGFVFNVLGVGLPIIIAIPATALMTKRMTTEAFGLFVLAFSLVGYASLLDLGISKAVVRAIAISKMDLDESRAVMGTATLFTAILSSVGAILINFYSEDVVRILNVSDALNYDAIQSLRLLSFSIPLLVVFTVLSSYLEGRQDFAAFNLVRLIANISVVIFPLVFVAKSGTLYSAVIGLLAARLINLPIAFYACYRKLGNFLAESRFSVVKNLFRFGAWLTVSNIIGPIMVNFDRYIISSFLGASNVAFYALPSDLVSKLLQVPMSLGRAIFPLLSNRAHDGINKIDALHFINAVLTLTVFAPIFWYSYEILQIWLGDVYAEHSASVLRILLVGFVFNSFVQIPFAALHSYGKSNVTAMIHLCELIPYFFILYFLLINYGIEGVAIAWSLRAFFDYLLISLSEKKHRCMVAI